MSRDPHRALLAALTTYLGPLDNVVARTRDWSSATFTGMLHDLSFTSTAPPVLIKALPDIDLPMQGHFVADLRIIACQTCSIPTQAQIEVLTIREDVFRA